MIVEKALTIKDDRIWADTETCRARGWIEILHEAATPRTTGPFLRHETALVGLTKERVEADIGGQVSRVGTPFLALLALSFLLCRF